MLCEKDARTMADDILIAPWAKPAPAHSGRLLTAADPAAQPEDGWQYGLIG
jgi:hypothetical protein